MRRHRPWGPGNFVLCQNALRCAALLFPLLAARMPAQVADSEGHAKPLLVLDRDFAADASLVADSKQTIVFAADARDSVGRFRLTKGTHRFCVSGGAGAFEHLLLEIEGEHSTERTLDGEGCALVFLHGENVTVRLRPGGKRPSPPAWATTTIRVDQSAPPASAAVPLVDSTNSPVGGYWAIQDTTINAQGTFGNRILTTAPGSDSHLVVDPSTAYDNLSLFQLPPISGQQLQAIPDAAGDVWSLFFYNPYVVNPCGYYCGSAYGPPPGIQIHDNGNYQFVWDLDRGQIAGDINLQANTQQSRIELMPNLQGNLTGDTFQVVFRYYPDGTQLSGLSAGEVSLSQGCNSQGKTAVFIPLNGAGVVSPPYPLATLSSGDTTLAGTAKSINIGAGSSVYWGPNPSTIQGAVVSSTSCLANGPTGQLFVEPVTNTLAVARGLLNNSCVQCAFPGQSLNYAAGSPLANFSNWNLTGADFSHTVLTNINMNSANLSGAKFLGATLTDVDLSNATLTSAGLDFTGATLTRVHFNGLDVSNFNFSMATLNQIDLGTDQTRGGSNLSFNGATLNNVGLAGLNAAAFPFMGATLCGISLSGTNGFNLLDLTSGNFAGAQVVLSSACAANLSYTKLNPAANIGLQWGGLNLTGAVVNGLQGKVLSTQSAPLNLGGAVLTGASLQGAVLDYAQGLAGQNLAGVQLNGASLRFVSLKNAQMFGAQMPNANLEGANMNGVVLTKAPDGSVGAANLAGAFLRGVNLSQAKLSGAIFSSSNFYSQVAVGSGLCTPDPNTGFTDGCATAAGATMDETAFNSAYLFGTDFTHATAQGVNFGDAFLVGANFANASLSASAGGGDSGFSGAFLQGANLSGLTLGGGVSLQNAFVDFMGGNTISLILGGEHTTFAGYWNTPGEAVCAQMTYSGATSVPVTNAQTTCPNGFGYTAGCGVTNGSNLQWKSQIDITGQASYLNNSTFTQAPASGNPICNADLKWVPLSLGRPPKHDPDDPDPPRHRRPRHKRPPGPDSSSDDNHDQQHSGH